MIDPVSFSELQLFKEIAVITASARGPFIVE
jgi:hypothetical protein